MRTILLVVLLGGCASAKPQLASVTRMMSAPARDPGCALEFVQASIMELSPMGKYDILGYVHVQQLAVGDPMAEENRRIVRPQACSLGGVYVSLMLSSAAFGQRSDASGTLYAVLRDKAAPAPAQPF